MRPVARTRARTRPLALQLGCGDRQLRSATQRIGEEEMRSWVEISLGTIRANFRAVRTLAGDAAEIMPVVKADAYRHSAIEVSRTLEEEGAPWLAVANVEEGVALRQAGIGVRILVMADFLPA